VQSTLVLDRETGNIVRTSGFAATSEASVGAGGGNGNASAFKGPEDTAAMVWAFVKASEGLVTGLDSEVSTLI
jgi:hypothetical protein